VRKNVEAEHPACYCFQRWMSGAQNAAAAPSGDEGKGSMVVVISQEMKRINNQRTNIMCNPSNHVVNQTRQKKRVCQRDASNSACSVRTFEFQLYPRHNWTNYFWPLQFYYAPFTSNQQVRLNLNYYLGASDIIFHVQR
jgi:hypothetical protein